MNRKIVCLCGSTRFSQAFQEANLRETLAGHIVLTLGCDTRSDADLFTGTTQAEREQIIADLEALHLDKITLADEVLVLNVGGYIGLSTCREVIHALAAGKQVRWLERNAIPPAFTEPLSLGELAKMDAALRKALHR